MLDVVMLALGLGFFAAAVGYTYACERLSIFTRFLHANRYPLRSKALWRSTTMIFDYSLAGLVSLGLLFYLTYALLRPERFCAAGMLLPGTIFRPDALSRGV